MLAKGSRIVRTALGWAGVAASGSGITRVVLPRQDRRSVERELARMERTSASSRALSSRVAKLLVRYFSGKRVKVDLFIDLGSATQFQRAVLRTAASIPYGETRSYAWVARKAGRPGAARAVGQALGANPVPLLIP